MKRITGSWLLAFALITIAIASTGAQTATTGLENGHFVDQLTGFAAAWDPTVFSGESPDIGGITLTSDNGSVHIFTATAANGAECLINSSTGLGVVDRDAPLPLPEFPSGSSVGDFVEDMSRDVVLACVPIGSPDTATTFVVIDLRMAADGGEWEALLAEAQPVIDSIAYPDPAALTTTGIAGNIYTDPLFGWSIQFDPMRYEAQYAAGTADSPFLSGLFLSADLDGESGGIWAERHDSVEACLAAQKAVNESLPEFSDAPERSDFAPASDPQSSGLWQFSIEPDGRFLVFAACQPMMDNDQQVDGVYLVTTFTAPESGFNLAAASWSALLEALSFREADPNGTPIA